MSERGGEAATVLYSTCWGLTALLKGGQLPYEHVLLYTGQTRRGGEEERRREEDAGGYGRRGEVEKRRKNRSG